MSEATRNPSDTPRDAPAEPAAVPKHTETWSIRRLSMAIPTRKLRNSEMVLILISGVLGGVIGLGVVLLHDLVGLLHRLVFGIAEGRYLSEGVDIAPAAMVLGPTLGGLLVGTLIFFVRKIRPGEIVDPIEANALFGGKMSLIDSFRLTISTLISNGCGASVGMEAAYTQTGSGLSSAVGQVIRLRRGDLRILTGCGAAAAIAAAFNAPLAGAFYAFELVIGSYTLAALAPVAVAAVVATLVARLTIGTAPIFMVDVTRVGAGAVDYAAFALVGFASGWLGILTMQAVTVCERFFRRLAPQIWIRPALGGLCVGLMAMWVPQVLGSGHGALQMSLDAGYTLPVLLTVLTVKILASAVSLGSGFRGGLFSSSLFLGSLFGGVLAQVADRVYPELSVSDTSFMLVGMGSVAAAIIGAPITMVMLVLESTADFPATVGVLTGVVVASVVVRKVFGYSFATWRFHLRGVPIRGAHDVGWIEDLTVGRLMRRDQKVVEEDMNIAALRRIYPLGSVKQVFVVDEAAQYRGLIDMAMVHNPDLDETADKTQVATLVRGVRYFLLPRTNVRTALKHFSEAEEETLPVLDSPTSRKVVGYLTEAYALRRYNQELEKQRSDELGMKNLYGSD
ncbi:chloride channel protein [Skermanella stibiiresistens SB22]|uniref:Chloride channel protein n=1 Tax=Skermanella stibiiresistens SB22 TaxID=1385369 RepID=W9H1Q0_9PROT|nr:chloride channel protein [Skermanella stibiiresistens]EWY38746.1 chloride channel protein [Skermanella stibiiresistens SB22]